MMPGAKVVLPDAPGDACFVGFEGGGGEATR